MGAYEDEIRQKTTRFERLGDTFNTSNERIDYLVRTLENSDIPGLKKSIESR